MSKHFLYTLTQWYLKTVENTPSTTGIWPTSETLIRLIIRQIFLRFLQEKEKMAVEGWLEQAAGLDAICDTTEGQALLQGLKQVFERYRFAIDEQDSLEEGGVLTPEVLGRVFEQLLAVGHSKSSRTARKRTGSFYTPREIVDYMAVEALVAYFRDSSIPLGASTADRRPRTAETAFCRIETSLGGDGGQGDFETRLRSLLACPDAPHLFNEAEVAGLIEAIDRIKILDPACGSGAFLMGLLWKLIYILGKLDPQNERWRTKQIERANRISDGAVREQALAGIAQAFEGYEADYGRKRYLIQNNIYGVDIQPGAVEIARLRFFLSLMVDWREDSGQPFPHPLMNLRMGNILLTAEQPWPNAFDLVIGNPPYINTNELKQMADIYRRQYETAFGSYDIYVLFFERAAGLARPNGLICFITSNKYLIADYGAKLRAFMRQRLALLKLLDLADCRRLFPGALVSACITLAQNRLPWPGAEVEIGILKDDDFSRLPDLRFERRALARLSSGDQQIFDIYVSGQKQRIIDKLLHTSLALGRVAEVRTGVMGFGYWPLRPFIHEGVVETGVRLMTNGFINPYEFNWGKRARLYGQNFYQPYLDIGSCPLNERTKAFFKGNKIVIRGVAKRLSAQLDEEGVGLLVAVHGAVVNDPARLEPKYLLALLNSKLMNWYHRVKWYAARIPQGSLKYPVSFLKSIPIKQIPPAQQQPFVVLVDQILAAKRAKPGADVSRLEGEIDRLVYRLYGLTEAEVREVENIGYVEP